MPGSFAPTAAQVKQRSREVQPRCGSYGISGRLELYFDILAVYASQLGRSLLLEAVGVLITSSKPSRILMGSLSFGMDYAQASRRKSKVSLGFWTVSWRVSYVYLLDYLFQNRVLYPYAWK